MSKIEIIFMSDANDCETCGSSYADGGVVKIDGETVIDLTPTAHCYDSISHTPEEIFVLLLKHLGHEVTTAEQSLYTPNYDEDDDE